MRTQVLNRTPFYYALYSRDVPAETEDGFINGESIVYYHHPVLYTKANISPATGISNVEQFGNLENYDKVIVTSDLSCTIDENSVLWIENQDTEKAYDYVVKRVAKSKNGISIAVAKVAAHWDAPHFED
jgi:hypothetical protein